MLHRLARPYPLGMGGSEAAHSVSRAGAERIGRAHGAASSAARLRQSRLVCSCRLACLLLPDGIATEILLRCEGIVGPAAQRDIFDTRWASSSMRVFVMEL